MTDWKMQSEKRSCKKYLDLPGGESAFLANPGNILGVMEAHALLDRRTRVTWQEVPGEKSLLASFFTNQDGRCDDPLLDGDAFETGEYELVFHLGDYFGGKEAVSFLNLVPVRFGISSTEEHYHVPLLASPFGYSTYRGS